MNYSHRPVATGMHAKLLRESCERSPYIVRALAGRPNHIVVQYCGGRDSHIEPAALWHGHRDLMPTKYRHARDPQNVLTRPASD